MNPGDKGVTTPVAVWYFVAATFTLSASTLFLDDASTATRVAVLLAGAALAVAGFVQMRRELRGGRRARDRT